MVPLGKKDLLRWAAETSEIQPCDKYADLCDGAVLVALALGIFPVSAPVGFAPILSHQGRNIDSKNWDVLRMIMEQHRLPMHLFDRRALSTGQARHCFNMLVLFYFLARLKHGSDFCLDFSIPIDPRMADFLQSPQSLVAIGKLSARPSANLAAVSSQRVGPMAASAVHAESCVRAAAAVASFGVSASPTLSSPREVDDSAYHSQLAGVRTLNARLQEELDNVRSVSQLLLAQQRVLVATEIAAMTEQLEAQLLLLRQQRDHEVRKCLREVREEYDALLSGVACTTRSEVSSLRVLSCSSGSNASSTDGLGGQQRLLEGKLRSMQRELDVADSTIQQLQTAVSRKQKRLDALEDRIRCICSCSPPVTNGECTTFIGSILELIHGAAPPAVVDAVGLRLKSLFLQLDALRCEVRRLRGHDVCDIGDTPYVLENFPGFSGECRTGATGRDSLGKCRGVERRPLAGAANICGTREAACGADEPPVASSGQMGCSGNGESGSSGFGESIPMSCASAPGHVPFETTWTSPTSLITSDSRDPRALDVRAAACSSLGTRCGSKADESVSVTFPSNGNAPLLTLEELERRKNEIMSKYGFSR